MSKQSFQVFAILCPISVNILPQFYLCKVYIHEKLIQKKVPYDQNELFSQDKGGSPQKSYLPMLQDV